MERWLTKTLGRRIEDISPASLDASFRRYFRIVADGTTHIVMDAPPELEDSHPFVQVANLFADIGLNVPRVIDADMDQGLLLLTDLGERRYLDELDENTVERLYGDALGALLTLQACGTRRPDVLPPYDDRLLMSEMELFRHWFMERLLELRLTPAMQAVLDESFELLKSVALEQPQVCVHRDYHSRNLMVDEQHNPGILDFQDAVVGPVTYDLVSLLKDCYITWPEDRVESWALGYLDLALQSGVMTAMDEARFLRWFDFMGVQRHLKASGIFSRLNLRDAKPGYLDDIPGTLAYVVDVSKRYPELGPLHSLLEADVLPGLIAYREKLHERE